MRILLSAFACQPGLGSEPGIGWNLATHLARQHDVTVLTAGRNRQAIVHHQGGYHELRLDFRFIELSRSMRWAVHRAGFHHLYYVLWQVAAAQQAADLFSAEPFDLIHHVTYVISWLPSLMGRFGIPFVWSAGQRDPTPRAFLSGMSLRGRFAEVVRNAAMRGLSAPTQLLTARSASLILTSSMQSGWPKSFRVEYFPLGGLSAEEIDRLSTIPFRREGPFRLASIGRLLGLKGLWMGICAFQRIRKVLPDSEYWIVGDGPERKHLAALARKLKLGKSVRFLGELDRAGVFQVMEHIDVLIHPSLHEQFGYVVVEGMAAGRPAICLDIGPFPAVLGDAGGFRIPRTTPSEVVDQLETKLIEWAMDRDRLVEIGRMARAWALERWHWRAVTERLMRLYAEI